MPAVTVLAALLAFAWAPAAQEARVTFRVTVNEEERVATVPVIERDGQPYVSLTALARAWGGGCRILPGRVQVDFARHTAWMQFNETQVDASRRRFAILHPVLRQGDAVLLAVSDVGPFFTKAFRALVKHGPARTAPPPQTRPALTREGVGVQELPDPGVLPALPPTPRPRLSNEMDVEPPPRAPASASRAKDRPIRTVIIDPGHGGADAGCEGREGLKEKDVVLAVAKRLAKRLHGAAGLTVRLTRRDDVDLNHKARAEFAAERSGDLLISIHAAGSLTSAANGFGIFYSAGGSVAGTTSSQRPWKDPCTDYAARSRALAEQVAASLLDVTSAANRGVHEVPCALLKEVFMPGLLIEAGYLTNAAEEALLDTAAYQERIAQGIAEGVLRGITAAQGAGAGS